MEILRLQWCSEPTVTSTKKTGPPEWPCRRLRILACKLSKPLLPEFESRPNTETKVVILSHSADRS